MAEKILNFSNDRDVSVKLLLVKLLPHCQYYFTKEEKVDYKNALNKMSAADQFIKKVLHSLNTVYLRGFTQTAGRERGKKDLDRGKECRYERAVKGSPS